MTSPYVGEIRIFGGNFAPAGWMTCQGQLLSISEYETLFNLIGTTYGGDGQSTFQLPDLQSRVPVHAGPGYATGQTGGAESVVLQTQHLPRHTHQAQASSATGTTTSPAGAVWAGWSKKGYSSAAPASAMSPAALGATGGGLPHDNLPPYLTVNFIISLFGIYPSPT
jgi:microcystin-dependent protein